MSTFSNVPTVNIPSFISVEVPTSTVPQTNSLSTMTISPNISFPNLTLAIPTQTTKTQYPGVPLTDILTTLTTFTNLPTLTISPNSTIYSAENSSYQQLINTTLCGLSCLFVANDTICVKGVCTHVIYPESAAAYSECGLCDLETSFCHHGSCYQLGNIGDVCLEYDQCQSYYCTRNNLSSPYSFCEPAASADNSSDIVLPTVYTLIGIGALIMSLYLICTCGNRNNRNTIRRSERGQRFEEVPLSMQMENTLPLTVEIENTDTLPPYSEAPPKYEEVGRETTHFLNEQEHDGSGEQVTTVSMRTDVRNSDTV